ncbi:alpha/beta hydrolase fold domain-containing protein [Nocardia sp. ET3-3]|uniref:Alpha/beta hydrolase fold domain-containing protein n=1 Tax=Nocardia terrae TaxID=2675851 RepID=A0A7K1V8W8_9NOCA|nr:alpha/beta hydrolase fold domain-containing protein [Nocardia terrae]MVU83016.1 alpha/beta hydrolase fold domain-containing protein [Nocardia terrae]
MPLRNESPAGILGRMVEPLPQTPEGVELRHLRAFVAVAEELNFGRAAQRLYVTQPALSRTVRGLEKLVGCDLFHRNTRSVSLTPAGAALLDRTRDVLTDLDAALTAARSAGGALSARMGQLWSPVEETFNGELAPMRSAFELMHAEFPMPEGIRLEPVNAGGVPGIQLVPAEDFDTTVVYAHGGGFMMGSAYGYRGMAGAVAQAGRARVLVPEYRLAPEHPFPAARDDVVTAYRWLLNTDTEPEQIALVGDSTGAMLLLSVLVRARDDGLPLPRATVLLCPAVDFYAPEDDPPADVEQHMRFQNAYLAGRSASDPEANPLCADLSGLPPTLVQSGEFDGLGRNTDVLVARLAAAGNTVRHDIFGVDGHAFQIYWSFHPEAADAVQQVGEFLQKPAPLTA